MHLSRNRYIYNKSYRYNERNSILMKKNAILLYIYKYKRFNANQIHPKYQKYTHDNIAIM